MLCQKELANVAGKAHQKALKVKALIQHVLHRIENRCTVTVLNGTP